MGGSPIGEAAHFEGMNRRDQFVSFEIILEASGLYLSSTAAAAGFFRMSFTLLSRENAIRRASFSLILW